MGAKFFVRLLLLVVINGFNSLGFAATLQDAVREAVNTNPEVRAAADHRSTAQQQLRKGQADYLPSLDFTGAEGYQNSLNPNVVPPGEAVNLNNSESNLSLTENLFKGFGTKNEVKRLSYAVESAAYKTAGTAEDTALDTTEKYLEVLRHETFVKLAQENLKMLKNTTHMIKLRVDAGGSKRADYDQALARLALGEDDMLAQQGSLIDAGAAYIAVVGSPAHDLVMPHPPENSQLPATQQSTLLEAVKNNPTLRSTNADVLAARAQHAASKSKNYPEINLVVDTVHNNNISGQPGADDSNEVVMRGSWNLYRGGGDLAEQRATAYQAQEAMDARNRTLRKVEENVRLSWNAWKESEQRLRTLKAHRDYTLSTYHSYQLQYKINQRTLLDVLDAENEYYQASLNYVTGEFTERFARYRILNTMGRLLAYLQVAPPREAHIKKPTSNFSIALGNEAK